MIDSCFLGLESVTVRTHQSGVLASLYFHRWTSTRGPDLVECVLRETCKFFGHTRVMGTSRCPLAGYAVFFDIHIDTAFLAE